MCVINGPARVAKTKILVVPDSKKYRQLTVYTNSVETQVENNAMILPVPFPNTVKFHSLDNYKDIFADCESQFPTPMFSRSAETNTLKVFKTNGYDVSIVPDIESFDQLDKNVFQLNSDVANLLKGKYSSDFGYLVCKLSTDGLVEYRPLAYSHTIMNNFKMFVPTLHYHGHEEKDGKADWDHVIYSINNKANDQDRYSEKSALKLDLLDPPFNTEQNTISKLELIGRYPNCDISFPMI